MRSFISSLIFLYRPTIFTISIFLVLNVIHAKYEPLECQIHSNRGVGTICEFQNVNGFHKDTSTIIAHPTQSFGQTITNRNVHSLRFEKSVFREIPNSVFTHFGDFYEGVRSVNFNTGKLNSINSKTFESAKDLVYIEFFNSKIEELSSRAFAGAKQLRKISLRQCEISKISKDAFTGLPHLEEVKLQGSTFDNYDFLNNLPNSVQFSVKF